MAVLQAGQWISITAEVAGERLDVALARLFPELSRSRAQKLILEGFVRCNGAGAKANLKLAVGDTLEVFLPLARAVGVEAQNIPLEILYQDEHLAVVEKPPGLVVHPAAGHEDGTLVNALLHHFPDLSTGSGIGGELRPGIVHRIDKNTSGILLITKTDLAHAHLSQQFKEHSISRRYLGLCWGSLPSRGEWNEAIARDPKERKRMAPSEKGRTALTRFRCVSGFPGVSLFEAELFTGRTHQIRVHFSFHGFPLVGDSVYGGACRAARKSREEGGRVLAKRCVEGSRLVEKLEEAGRQFLHAAHLGFVHPVSQKRMEFNSELPEDLREIMLALEPCK